MAYDSSNVFAKILRGEIPNKTVYADDTVLAFHDINPKAPVHVLVVPRGEWVSWDDFCREAPAETIAHFFSAVAEIARQLGLHETGYRVIANTGRDGCQEVPHFHVHILGGRPMGPMVLSAAR